MLELSWILHVDHLYRAGYDDPAAELRRGVTEVQGLAGSPLERVKLKLMLSEQTMFYLDYVYPFFYM